MREVFRHNKEFSIIRFFYDNFLIEKKNLATIKSDYFFFSYKNNKITKWDKTWKF